MNTERNIRKRPSTVQDLFEMGKPDTIEGKHIFSSVESVLGPAFVLKATDTQLKVIPLALGDGKDNVRTLTLQDHAELVSDQAIQEWQASRA